MNIMNKDEIYEIVYDFHSVIVMNKDYVFHTHYWFYTEYENFPFDRCDSTSELINKFLYEKFWLIFNLVKVNYWKWSHVFLENDNFIIDITAYQFNSLDFIDFKDIQEFPEVIVFWKNEIDKYYFAMFEREEYIESYLKNTEYDDYFKFYDKLIKDYERIKNVIR